METEPCGSINAEVLDIAGADNIADPGNMQGVRRMQVSIEQVLVWNPDVIIISSDGDENHSVYQQVLNGGAWGHMKAVQNLAVYEIPTAPYDWVNRPPSVARVIGVKWLTNLLYPDQYQIDVDKDVQQFFQKFYNIKLNDNEVDELLTRSRKND